MFCRHGATRSVLLLASLFLVGSTTDHPRITKANAGIAVPVAVLADVNSGDLIFRRGTDLVSDTVDLVDGSGWSHVGMLLKTASGWQVIHAVPAETPGQEDAVVMESLPVFASTEHARAIALFHIDANAAEHARAVDWARQQLGVAFGFEPGEIYCTELVWAAWNQADVDLDVPFTKVGLSLFRGEYLLPSGLLQSPHLHRVWRSMDSPGHVARPSREAADEDRGAAQQVDLGHRERGWI